MFIQVLPLNFKPTLIFALNDFEETSFVMTLKVFINNDLVAFKVLAINPSKIASNLM